MDIEIQKLTTKDIIYFSQLIKLFKNVFESTDLKVPDQLHLQKLLEKKSFIVFAAIKDNMVVGGLTAYVLEGYYSENPSAYVYDVAVLPELHRKGIGKKLLASINNYCSQNGFSEVFVQAETADLQAVNFYRSTPIISELQATHFTYSIDKSTQRDFIQ